MSPQESNGLKKYIVSVGASITIAIVLQSGILLHWTGAMGARMDNAEREDQRFDVRITHLERKEHE